MAGRRTFRVLTITSSPASKLMPIRYNIYTLDYNNTQPISNNITQVVSGFSNTSLAHKHFPFFKMFTLWTGQIGIYEGLQITRICYSVSLRRLLRYNTVTLLVQLHKEMTVTNQGIYNPFCL